MGVTSHDVARLADVSQPTVSRALRGDPRVAEATRQRVIEAAAELGYVASDVGRSLSTQKTMQIAMVADMRNALYPSLVAPLHDRFAKHGFRMVLLAERGDDRGTYEQLLGRSVDGAVLTTTLTRSTLSKALLERGMPFVELNRVSGRSRIDTVTADNVEGAMTVTRLLLAEGHRRIGTVFGSADTSSARDRERGVRAVLEEAGLPLPSSYVVRGGFGHDDGERACAQLLSLDVPPSAIVCVSDAVAIGVMTQAQRRGLSIPGDLAVVGFDDLAPADWPPFRLTSVHVDFHAMAVAAADALVERIEGQRSRARSRVFPTEIVVRDSHRLL